MKPSTTRETCAWPLLIVDCDKSTKKDPRHLATGPCVLGLPLRRRAKEKSSLLGGLGGLLGSLGLGDLSGGSLGLSLGGVLGGTLGLGGSLGLSGGLAGGLGLSSLGGLGGLGLLGLLELGGSGATELVGEALDASTGVDELLLAGVERVALVAKLDLHLGHGSVRLEGVAAGARTGLASVVTAILFALSLFLGPVFGLIPSAAIAPALIFVGFLMMKSVTAIDFNDPTEGIPAFVTIMAMPFSYSISKGISWGIIAYVICKISGKKAKDISVVTWILAAVFLAEIIFESVRG